MAILITAMFLTVLLPMSFEGAGANYGKKTNLSTADASFVGSAAGDTLGYAGTLSSRGDVNGDGYSDLLIPESTWSNGTTSAVGKISLIFGKASGWGKGVNINTASVTFVGLNKSDQLGWSAAIAGDLNGDGFDDIVVSAPWAKNTLNNQGIVYIIFGKAAGWPKIFNITKSNAWFTGENADDSAGETVTAVGDVNGDGFNDILIGSMMYNGLGKNSHSGKVYLILGKATGWTKNQNLSQADATFLGEEMNANLDSLSTHGGDLNGDGLDDMIMASENFGNEKGKTYVFFGKTSGWAKNVNVTTAPASFIGEMISSDSGYPTTAAGDINGDGIHDLVIAANLDGQGGSNAGQVYIIFGKKAGWAQNVSLANVDASINYTAADGYFGGSISTGGDVNGDGINDLLIGATGASDGALIHCGETFLFLGKKSGWAMDTPSRNADAIFVGENTNDDSGVSAVITGDLNGDGFDDIGIGADYYNFDAGKYYVLFYDTNKPPTAITYVKAFASPDYTNETGFAMPGDTIYVELRGTDGNASRKDVAVVKLMTDSAPKGYNLRLYETGINTGIYRGSFKLDSRTWEEHQWIKGTVGDMVMVTSFTDLSKSAMLTVGGIELMPKADLLTAHEDHLYNVHYWVTNVTTPHGVFETNATWLGMNGTTQNVSGTPDNSNVGSFWVRLNVTDAFGRSDEHNFTVVVANTPPTILTTDSTSVDEDEYYAVDYNSTDDGQGVITWHLATDASWLKINATTGLLNGTPVNSNVGQWYVNVSVNDGHGGKAFHNFTLTVVNINDRPSINTTDVKTATEEVLYQVDYKVVDVDVGDTFTWSLKTDASWLKINAATGRLNGTPTFDDAGSFYVNVTVKDQGGLFDFHNFTLAVQNVNRPPVWKDVPPFMEGINSLQTYTFDVNATDPDKQDKLTYGVIVTPSVSAVSINMTTGVFSIGPLNAGIYSVNLTCTDNMAGINYVFKLTVTHKNSPPTVVLTGPAAGAIVTSAKPVLSWTTADKDADQVTVDVYFSDIAANVNTGVASAMVLTTSKAKSYAFTSYLTPGKTYYWTVIPYDGNETGTCLNGTISFTVSATAKVNHAPTISPPAKVPDATTGKTYKLTVAGSDQDAGSVLTYSLGAGAPAGMSISNSGLITWTPTKDQSGNFPITVVVSDGEFKASTPVTLYVNKASEAGPMWIPIVLILILAILAIVLLAMSMRKTPAGEGEEEETAEEKDEAEEEEAGEEEEDEKTGDEEEDEKKAGDEEDDEEKAGDEEDDEEKAGDKEEDEEKAGDKEEDEEKADDKEEDEEEEKDEKKADDKKE